MERTPPRTPVPPVPPQPAVPPAPTPVPASRRRPVRRFSAALFWAVVGALAAVLATMLAGYGIAPVKYTGAQFLNGMREQQAAPSVVHHKATPPKVKETAVKPVVTPVTSVPAPQPVAPPPPKKLLSSPPGDKNVSPAGADVDVTVNVRVAPPPVAPPPAAPPPPKKPAESSGLTLQFNVFANGWNGGYGSGYHGHSYGWTPGHEELRYDPHTGTYYRTWIPHPHPSY